MDVSLSRGQGTRIALAISISLNIALLVGVLWPDGEPDEPAVVADVTPVEDEPAADAIDAPVEAVAKKAAPRAAGDIEVTIASLKNSIPQTLAVAAEPYGDSVSATLSRVLVWDLDLRRDLRAGDKIEAAWSLGTSDTVVIEAARFHAQKFNRTIDAYRFHATGDTYPSYWSSEGVELPHQLKNGPLDDYEQVTSLLRDRPTHHGMDFKVDVGTPIKSTADGVVTRVNWNWSANGNCIEVKHADGMLAKYLHLSENKVAAGDRVKTGEVIGLTGNTGRSTGPHLHYQLNKGAKVIDPIDYHGTIRRTLPEGDRAAFAEVVKASNARFDEAHALAAVN